MITLQDRKAHLQACKWRVAIQCSSLYLSLSPLNSRGEGEIQIEIGRSEELKIPYQIWTLVKKFIQAHYGAPVGV